jgi:hypothetical protein
MDSANRAKSTDLVALELTKLIVEQEGKVPGAKPFDRQSLLLLYRRCHRLTGRIAAH